MMVVEILRWRACVRLRKQMRKEKIRERAEMAARRAKEQKEYEARLKAAGKKGLNDLLRENTYAALVVCNIIDWMGKGVDDYREALQACTTSHGGYVGRMKQKFGLSGGGKKKSKVWVTTRPTRSESRTGSKSSFEKQLSHTR